MVTDGLIPLYGDRFELRGLSALDELIFTVLTQNTSDINAERAYDELRKRFPTWEAVMEAPLNEVKDAIRRGGLANIKSVRIINILRHIYDLRGNFNIDDLKALSLDEARKWLMALPGVGIKTASVVCAFSLDLPAMPVDTHIHRVSKRLELVGKRMNAEHAHYHLESLVPAEERFLFHMLLITHGRKLCKAIRPRCSECPLASFCPSASRYVN